VLYGEIANQRQRPSQLFAADDDAREVAEELILAAGFEPVFVGGLELARVLEDQIQILAGIGSELGGAVFYRYAQHRQL
jgi:8-hydroxy-5-deazaflavin:NADPH oxidoreductase